MSYPDMTVFGHDPWWLILVKALAIFVFLLLTVLVAILARAQDPGPHADALRAQPGRAVRAAAVAWPTGSSWRSRRASSRRRRQAVYLAGAGHLGDHRVHWRFAVIPFGPVVSVFGHRTPLQLTDLPVAVLYVLAIASIGVYGIVLAGWSSGSTYPLLGGLRSSAQVISYEIAMALSFAAVFLYAGHHVDLGNRRRPGAHLVRRCCCCRRSWST